MGGIKVNDRAVNLLEKYDLEILQTKKGRGAILCETVKGNYIFKEYHGTEKKAELQDLYLQYIKEQTFFTAEEMVRNQEGELLTEDSDGVKYMLKTFPDGKECNLKETKECQRAMHALAKLHSIVLPKEEQAFSSLPVFQLKKEYERHNKELKRVRRYLKQKSQKTDFEIFLNRHFDSFLYQAEKIYEEWETYAYLETEEEIRKQGILCHGDYQHHNILVKEETINLINFERFVWDQPIRDLYLFMRKLLEKNNWSKEIGEVLLKAYESERVLGLSERISLIYRFAYPEKFWKIVNFYYNSGKAWIPGKNMEKLQKVLEQEKEKEIFLEWLRGN